MFTNLTAGCKFAQREQRHLFQSEAKPESVPDVALAPAAPSGVVVGRLLDAIAAAGSTTGGVGASSADVLAVALAAEAVVKDPSSPCVLRSATSVTEIEVRAKAPRSPGVD